MDGDKIHVDSPRASALLSLLVKGPQDQRVPNASPADLRGESHGDSLSWCCLASNPHLEIAQDCVRLLRKQFADNRQEATMSDEGGTNKSTETSSLLSYASEHWLTHMRLWDTDVDGHNANQSLSPDELDFAVDFVSNHHASNKWLQHRNFDQEGNVQPSGRYDIIAIATTLGLDIKRRADFLMVMKTVQLASGIQTRHGGNASSSVAIVLGQLDNVEALKRLGDTIPEEALELVFRTGADTSLCYLAERYPEFVSRQWATVITYSVDLANVQLLGQLFRDVDAVTANDDVNLAFHLLPQDCRAREFSAPRTVLAPIQPPLRRCLHRQNDHTAPRSCLGSHLTGLQALEGRACGRGELERRVG